MGKVVIILVILILLLGGFFVVVLVRQNGSDIDRADSQVILGVGDYEFSLAHEGLERSYLVHVPSSYNGEEEIPVVLNFHGGGHNAEGVREQSGMDETSESKGFIVVYPSGTGRKVLGKDVLTWNAGICCGDARDNNVNDVDFVREVLDDLREKFKVDEKRVYATGYSNGGFLAYKLACEMPERIAAIAPIGSSLGMPSCDPSRNVPIIHFHGIKDPCVPYNGGECGGCLGEAFGICDATQDLMKNFAERYSCDSEAIQEDEFCETYVNCAGGAEVTLCSIEDAGHIWPGSTENPLTVRIIGQDSIVLNANDVMWEFFAKHPI